ncbi:MAG: biotin synthase BioB [cyanobacterium endosymbiont of Rhopalodia musculus]|uniref:biotin synthase BioB n=1 Tax=cyanobacterium endosymbiont of Epithemia clementina EcSB TaxID=3034674 RepID=UPI0024808F48|nr:biotin synthase BioB [cyanobacterium endosymbiont of Epithemia clementina EcSB]WGT68470.1 biotin synthase BioB [cyanobacterium endosymbiont of Epithemia clementina EcSB]
MVQVSLSSSPSTISLLHQGEQTLKDWLNQLAQRIIEGIRITRSEALTLTEIEGQENILLLCEAADYIKHACCGTRVDLCSIVNVKSGNCSEDCSFCSQSVHHQGEDSPIYGLKSSEEILDRAKSAAAAGAKRFCLVSQGRGSKYQGVNSKEFEQILETIQLITTKTDIKPCCALGEITAEQARSLKAAGVTRYNHNLEASENFYPEIVTSHSWRDRVKTVKTVKEAGIQSCTGGILGMGETWEDRIDLALALRELEVESVPINLLNPRKGTPLGGRSPLNPFEVLKAISIFRFILPQQILRYAGGRETVMGELQSLGLKAGINAMLIGHYLTTFGQLPERDIAMVESLGLQGGEAPIPGEHKTQSQEIKTHRYPKTIPDLRCLLPMNFSGQ